MTRRVVRQLSLQLMGLICAVLLMTSLGVPNTAMAAARDLPDFADLVEKAGPAVVNIRTTQKVGGQQGGPQGAFPPGFPGMDPNDPFYEFFKRFMPPGGQVPQQRAPQPEREVQRGVGSGFIIDNKGFVLTNHHVVEGAETIFVTLSDKREFKAKIIGSDQRTDVALVKIEGPDLPFLKVGDVSKAKVGQWVLAIGSPFGLENTVTAGIISAKARDTGEYLPFIQTDVAVNPGNSGGPLLNLDGEVIGINSQIYSRTGGFMGISFAIPIDEAMRVANQLRSSGKVSRGRIGVGIGEVDKEIAEALGLKEASGALVTSVSKDGPADKAGVISGDIIMSFNGKKISKSSDLPRVVGETKPGSTATLNVWRKGESVNLKVAVAEFENLEPKPATKPEAKPEVGKADKLGLVVVELSGDKRKSIGNGVEVKSVEGTAAAAGIAAGDVITRIGNTDISSAKQFTDLVNATKKGQAIALLVKRGENSFYVRIAL